MKETHEAAKTGKTAIRRLNPSPTSKSTKLSNNTTWAGIQPRVESATFWMRRCSNKT